MCRWRSFQISQALIVHHWIHWKGIFSTVLTFPASWHAWSRSHTVACL